MHKNGFTLIELLVSISILLLLTVLGLTSMFSFNNRQHIIQAEEMVAEAVYRTQSLARSGKMNGCNRLDGYQIQFFHDVPTGKIEIQAVCVPWQVGDPPQNVEDPEIIVLPNHVSFDVSVTAMVQAENGILDDDLDRDTQPIEYFELTLTGDYSKDYSLELSKEGKLETGAWL